MPLSIPDRTTPGSHIMVPGLTMEWLGQGQIAAFTLMQSSHEVIESYYQLNLLLMEQADRTPETLLLTLHDVSAPKMALTALLQSRLNELAQRVKQGQVQHRSAVVLSKSPLAWLFSTFSNLFAYTAVNTIQKTFTDRGQAVRWLEQYID